MEVHTQPDYQINFSLLSDLLYFLVYNKNFSTYGKKHGSARQQEQQMAQLPSVTD